MKNLFRGYRNGISNAAQIILVVFLLPFVAVVLRGITGKGGSDIDGLLSSLIENIPLCEIWMSILSQYTGGITVSDVASSTVLIILKALPETLISAICVDACLRIAKKIEARGLPIFPTFVGIVIATVVTSLTGLAQSDTTELLVDIMVVIIMLIGIRFMFKSMSGGMGALSAKGILVFIIDGLFAVITTAYVTGLLMAANGAYATNAQAIGRVAALTGIEVGSAVLFWFIRNLAEPELD